MDLLDATVQLALPTLAAAALLVWFRDPHVRSRAEQLPRPFWWLLFALTRFAYPLGIFVVLDVRAASDSWYWKISSARTVAGGIPGVDHVWIYGPALAWLQGALRAIAPGGHWIVTLLPFVAGDALAITFGARLARASDARLRTAWITAWLVLSPLLWHQLVVRGQDESLFVGMLAIAACAAMQERPTLCDVLLGLGILLTKPTFLPFAAVLVATLRPQRGAMLRASVAAMCVAAPWYILLPATYPSRALAENTGVGISATDLLGRVTGIPFILLLGIFALAAGGVVLAVLLRGHRLPPARRACVALAAMQCAVMLFMPACRSPYVSQALVMVLIVVAMQSSRRAQQRALIGLILLGWIAVEVWTLHPFFTVTLKPLSLAFHSYVLFVCARELGVGRR